MRWLAAWVLPLAAQAGVGALQCSEGTVRLSDYTGKGEFNREWCLDMATREKHGPSRLIWRDGVVAVEYQFKQGKKHGLARSWTRTGEPEQEILFENGVEVRRRFLMAALREMFESGNEDRRRRGIPGEITLIDEHTLDFALRSLDIPRTPEELSEVEGKLRASPEICFVFDVDGTHIETMNVKYVTDAGKVLQSVKITRRECVGRRKQGSE